MPLKEDLYAVLFCSLIKIEYREMVTAEDSDDSLEKTAQQPNIRRHHMGAIGSGALRSHTYSRAIT
eukprot:CAMPEP_0185621708 /NCGR_PEP_ID=MMETSP0436-20130131/58263_1 /TAXON_ID=626734 ORGANISM="Favella taraikaensis, Strain Fe Narragansett Bay" /NCGR_SAMPLE_ID=MMETSP0436 /ASSEMBLY_ACC=CAM_ASM_000390 /LENGTH=65 /DNA_ID=CAMNT_0028263193 /DNA_START=57 /DNA_END=254 /DNA_ORIENTATION=+